MQTQQTRFCTDTDAFVLPTELTTTRTRDHLRQMIFSYQVSIKLQIAVFINKKTTRRYYVLLELKRPVLCYCVCIIIIITLSPAALGLWAVSMAASAGFCRPVHYSERKSRLCKTEKDIKHTDSVDFLRRRRQPYTQQVISCQQRLQSSIWTTYTFYAGKPIAITETAVQAGTALASLLCR